MKKFVFLGMFAAVLAISGLMLSTAADAQAPGNTWTGLYIGGNIGAVRNRDTGVISCITGSGVVNGTGCPFPAFGTSTGNGSVVGGQIGYNWQFNKFVVGAEFDLDNSTLQNTSRFTGTINCIGAGSVPGANYSATSNLTTLGTERLRVGFLTSPKVFVYATGGFAQGLTKQQDVFVFPGPTNGYPMSAASRRTGTIEGIGAEWRVQPRLSVKFEVLSFYLRNVIPYAFTAPGVTTGFQSGKDFEYHGAMLRAGFNWKIGR